MSADDLPDLFSLWCFVTLSKTLSFAETARRVHLSAAALSDRIKRLERDVGGALFARTTRHVALTPLGESLLPATHRLLNEAWSWRDGLSSGLTQTPYTLKIGTRFELGLSWLVPSLERLKTHAPNRNLQLVWGVDRGLLSALLEGEIDALISSVRVNMSNLESAPLHREDYVFVSAPGYAPPNISADSASNYTLIDTEPALPLFRYFLDALPSGAAWEFGKRGEGLELLGTIAAVRARALEGVGVAVLPHYFVEADLERGSLIRLRSEITPHHDFFRLLWRADQPREQSVRRLIAELRDIPLS